MDRIMNILGIVTRVLIIIVLLVTSLLSIGTAYIMFAPDSLPKPFRLMYDMAPPAETVVEETPIPEEVLVNPGQGIIVSSGTKIINLNGTAGTKYIRVTISLEFNPTNPNYLTMKAEEKTAYLAEFQTEVTAKMPIVDHEIITLISTKTYDNLYTAAGKEALRQELLTIINHKLEEPKVIAIYFTEFVIN